MDWVVFKNMMKADFNLDMFAIFRIARLLPGNRGGRNERRLSRRHGCGRRGHRGEPGGSLRRGDGIQEDRIHGAGDDV